MAHQRRQQGSSHKLTTTLDQALVRFSAYGAFIFVVAVGFETSKRAHVIHRSSASDGLVNDELQIFCAAGVRQSDQVIAEVVKVWGLLYGNSRVSGTDAQMRRIDKGEASPNAEHALMGWLPRQAAVGRGYSDGHARGREDLGGGRADSQACQ